MPRDYNNIYDIINEYLRINNEEEIEVLEKDINDVVNFYSTLPINLETKKI